MMRGYCYRFGMIQEKYVRLYLLGYLFLIKVKPNIHPTSVPKKVEKEERRRHKMMN